MRARIYLCVLFCMIMPHIINAISIYNDNNTIIKCQTNTGRKKFDHQNIKKQDLIKCKHKYGNTFKILYELDSGEVVDMVELSIDESSYNELSQLCINAWYKVKKEGSDYTYYTFSKKHKFISKENYLNDIDYLEILSELFTIIKNTLLND